MNNTLNLEGHGVSIYGHIHDLHNLYKVHISYYMHLYVWNLFIHIVLCQGESTYILILEVDDQNIIIYVFTTKDAQVVNLNFNIQQHQRVKLTQIMQLNIKLILDTVAFDMIN